MVRQIFRGTDFPPKSLISLLLDSVDVGEKESSGVEEILTHALRMSLLVLISEELRKNLTQQGDGGALTEEGHEDFRRAGMSSVNTLPCHHPSIGRGPPFDSVSEPKER